MSTMSAPTHVETNIRRVAILFAGGPAPAANAVISTAAGSFLKSGVSVLGILNGYSNLIDYSPEKPLEEGRAYITLDSARLKRTRNTQGVMIGTARSNPGKYVSHPDHLKDVERTAPLKRVYDALCSLNVDALVSIGGDDTLKSANKFKLYQEHLPAGSKCIPVVHLPKTIDNDYMGIDFTFGYFTAVDTLASEIRNLLADAEANNSYFLAETMGRTAGWLAYGSAIAGEASFVASVEDINGKYREQEKYVDDEGNKHTRPVMNMELLVRRTVATMRTREEKEGKAFGVLVMAEGLAELLPQKYIEGVGRDEHGHLAIGSINLSKLLSKLIAAEYEKQTGKKKKITGLQLGYEVRCARPQAFDVMLGSQLGVGAYRALVEKGLNGVMVSVAGQLALNYVPFETLVDPATLVTRVRYVEPDSDFHKLARFLETWVND